MYTEKDQIPPGLDQTDVMVYHATLRTRNDYLDACAHLGLRPRPLPAVTIGARSVR